MPISSGLLKQENINNALLCHRNLSLLLVPRGRCSAARAERWNSALDDIVRPLQSGDGMVADGGSNLSQRGSIAFDGGGGLGVSVDDAVRQFVAPTNATFKCAASVACRLGRMTISTS